VQLQGASPIFALCRINVAPLNSTNFEDNFVDCGSS
jgi:hypothetical protein